MNDIIALLNHTNSIYIFGAQSRAKTLMGYVKELFPTLVIRGFLTDNEENNDAQIENIPVFHMVGRTDLDTTVPVFLATKGIFHERIAGRLKDYGFHVVCPINVEADNCLRNAYVSKVYAQQGRAFVKLEYLQKDMCDEEIIKAVDKKSPSVCICVAKSVYDRELETPYSYPDYEIPVQVGAALTAERLKGVEWIDSTGDNISERNRQYSELTGLYWMWKNCRYDIAGLAHYRRHFILPPDWQDIMIRQGIDAIVPVPTYVYPNIDANYRERHIPDDWDFLLQYLKETDRDAYETALDVFGGSLYLPCNMFIAKWEVLDALCSWMFPVLDAVTKNGGTKEDVYMNRYAGFVSERLITLFFTMNHDKYKIVYADRIFLK